MKTSIVALARNEESYIDEWINYHLELGFTHIYIYDDNDKPGNLRYLNSEKITVIENARPIFKSGAKQALVEYQKYLYRKEYKKYSKLYDWITFIDIDEFITIKENNISEFLEKFNDTDVIHLRWYCYGDNDNIYYEDKPVIERFTKPIKEDGIIYREKANNWLKSIIRTNKDLRFKNAHTVLFNDCVCKTGEGNIHDNNEYLLDTDNYTGGYIRHYITKSLEEYINRRIKPNDKYIIEKLNNYFSMNEKTEEKINYIQSMFPNTSLHLLK